MPHLTRIALKYEPPSAEFPYSVPAVRTLPPLDVNVPVTFFVGENGSGKSTLLEAIGYAAELPTIGGAETALDDSLRAQRTLGANLRLAWAPRSRQGFFLRAEDFFGGLKRQARDDARLLREKGEADAGISANAPREGGPVHIDEVAAARHIAKYDARSHGESFMDLFSSRFRSGGLYLLDEPEAPLSPKRQVALVRLLLRMGAAGAQFIIASHSPVLLSCPGARVFTFDDLPVHEVEASQLDHVVVTRGFLSDPMRWIRDAT